MYKIFDVHKESGFYIVPTKRLARRLCNFINSRSKLAYFDYDKLSADISSFG